MNDAKTHMTDWLRDAYAMEQHALSMMQRQAERIENYPELKQKVLMHIEETKWQVSQLEECFRLTGETNSTVKDLLGKLSANMGAMGMTFADDEVMKGSLATTVFEHLEIVTYKTLITAARKCNYPKIANICQKILAQEEAMAAWLEAHLPETTDAFLFRDAAGIEAKI